MSLVTITSPSEKKEGTHNRVKVLLVLALLVALVAGAVGVFATLVTPQEKIGAARSEIERARSYQAERYEPELLQKAQSDLQSALAEVNEQNEKMRFLRTYKEAERLLPCHLHHGYIK